MHAINACMCIYIHVTCIYIYIHICLYIYICSYYLNYLYRYIQIGVEVHLFCPQPARRLSSTDVFWTCLRVPVDKFRPLELPACWRELWGSRNWLAARADVFPVACWSPLNKRRGWGKNDEKWGKGQFAFEKLFDRTVWWSDPPQLQTTWFSGSAQVAGKYVRLSNWSCAL
jgi:hypothetical protein